MGKEMKQPERPFMNLSVEEMAAKVQQRDAELGRRNCLVLALFAIGLLGAVGVGFWFYGAWIVHTMSAFGQVVLAMWQFEWWRAGALLFEYKLSFFVMGILVGFFVFLFVVLQIGEMLLDLLLDWVGSIFS